MMNIKDVLISPVGLFLQGVLIVLLQFGCNSVREPDVYDEMILKDQFTEAFYVGTALNRAQIYAYQQEPQAEISRAEKRGYYYRKTLIHDTEGLELARLHFNAVTPENVMKWEHIHPLPGRFDFQAADELVAFAEENDMFVTGHTLVWHNQTPDWVFHDDDGELVDRETLLTRMRDHIHSIVGRYKGRVSSWDVVNEALNEDGSLRESLWYQIIGEDYLLKAFQYAHEADPEAELYYNDYNMEVPAKRDGAIRLIRRLREQGAPVTGIGTQSHFRLHHPDTEEIEKTIALFGELGLDVMVTELDISVYNSSLPYDETEISSMSAEEREALDPYAERLPDSLQQELTERYADLFRIYLEHRDKISRVTFWGVSDRDTWRNYYPVEGRTDYPLLFDYDRNPKPAFHAIISVAQEYL